MHTYFPGFAQVILALSLAATVFGATRSESTSKIRDVLLVVAAFVATHAIGNTNDFGYARHNPVLAGFLLLSMALVCYLTYSTVKGRPIMFVFAPVVLGTFVYAYNLSHYGIGLYLTSSWIS